MKHKEIINTKWFTTNWLSNEMIDMHKEKYKGTKIKENWFAHFIGLAREMKWINFGINDEIQLNHNVIDKLACMKNGSLKEFLNSS